MKRNKITKNDSTFPSELSLLAQVPDALYYRGADLSEILTKPVVAIVGSRKISNYGRAVTTKLTQDLARAGVVIVSGLALGVDSVAHAAALDAGGLTIAVLPCGIDTIYPAGHFGLAKRILQQGGALISEYDGADKPMKHQFIARNRIIAALSKGVIITEAAAKSGSLHTAEFALEQGTEVFAVPGNITSPTSEGTNNLIKAGATPITTADDVLQALGIQRTEETIATSTPQEARVIELLQQGITDQTELQIVGKLSPNEYSQAVTMLELVGKVSVQGSHISLT